MKDEKVCIVGLGYVGLPLAYLALKKGFIVYGYDVDKKKVEAIKNKKCPIKDKELVKRIEKSKKNIIASTDPNIINNASIIIICVPTPVDESHNPNLKALKSATRQISRRLKKGNLIIVESTVYPGVTEEIVKPILEKSGLKSGEDFYLSHCPERIDPGNKKWNIENVPRVFGSLSKKGAGNTKRFYEKILDAEILQMSEIKAAEAVKIIENTFRDVNIALVNELAQSLDMMDIDIIEVIKGASTKPYSFLPHYPGCGVGGHCIPVDPYYLIERGKKEGFTHSFLSLARTINNSMPFYTTQRVLEGLNEIKKSVKDAKIAVLGLAYKADVDDIRGSPAFDIIKNLKKMGADLEIYDPYIPNKSTVKNLNSALDNSECIVICSNHKEFTNIKTKELNKKNIKVVVDGRNCLNKKEIIEAGIIYRGIGR